MIVAFPGSNFLAVVEGVPDEADLTVRIVSVQDGSEVMAATYEGIFNLGGGTYRANLFAPEDDGQYLVQWEYDDILAGEVLVVSSAAEPATEPYYPSAATLVEQSTVEALASLTEAQQDALRSAAISAVEEHVGQSFTPFSGIVQVPSQGGYEVLLPRRLRLLDAVYSSRGDLLEPEAVVLGPNKDRLIWRQNIVGVGYYEQALFEVSGRDYPTRFGRDTLQVAGEWGWDAVPQPVVDAIRYDMEDQAMADASALTQTVHVFRRLGLTTIDQGNLRATLGPVGGGLSPRVTRVLKPYVFLGTGGYVV